MMRLTHSAIVVNFSIENHKDTCFWLEMTTNCDDERRNNLPTLNVTIILNKIDRLPRNKYPDKKKKKKKKKKRKERNGEYAGTGIEHTSFCV